MSFLSRIVENRGGSGDFEQRSPNLANFQLPLIPSNLDGHMADSGEPVSERTALQLGIVYSCVRILSDTIASLPMRVYRHTRDENVEAPLRRTEIYPTPPLIDRPWDFLNSFEWKFQMMTSLALRGNSYHLVTARDKYEYPLQLEPCHPDMVIVEYDYANGRRKYEVAGQEVDTADILHVRRFSLPAALVGLSPIQQARQAIGIGLAADRFGARYFGDSASPSAVLSTDQDMNPEASEHLKNQWIASNGGRRFPAVLSGGLKYEAISITPEESQFLETRNYQANEIAMLYGIPPHMLGMTDRSTSWGSGIEQISLGFVRYTLRPWLECIESAVSQLLPRNQFMEFDTTELLRGDIQGRYNSYTQARNAGWMSVNEIRAKESLPPVPDGDGYIQPVNYGPLGMNPLEVEPSTIQGLVAASKLVDSTDVNQEVQGDASDAPKKDDGSADTSQNVTTKGKKNGS